MKDGSTNLYNDEASGRKVTAYADAHSTPLPAHITAYHAEACSTRSDSHMLSSHFQNKLHLFLARAINAKRVLEVGVYVGYSAMLWAHATGPDGHVTALEYSEELSQVAREGMAKANVTNVEIITGNAAETLPELNTAIPYDIVFLDADKTGYSTYLSIILARSQPGDTSRLLRPGGLIVADNVLRRGHVADPARTDREFEDQNVWNLHLDAVRKFNDQVASEKRLEVFMVPLWDGLSLIRLID
ncbi:O-methyltransferase, family 3 [Moelleriella libera RCEF 2490]|uniref:O-methyltransferase, family 3 n=1 Tax=Moelleriella libera RCEF 2490 TaxID=1081109 RepID=A0A166VAY0_9HYPO|nr:O-methyltransferase, family 3 [Moelleriella libera RCEF 2490]